MQVRVVGSYVWGEVKAKAVGGGGECVGDKYGQIQGCHLNLAVCLGLDCRGSGLQDRGEPMISSLLRARAVTPPMPASTLKHATLRQQSPGLAYHFVQRPREKRRTRIAWCFRAWWR